MSAQAGIWNIDGRPVDPELLAHFSDALRRQGPDGQCSYIKGGIALLYQPFHTTAESRRERQPYLSPRGFILTWDGRLDNREELIIALHGVLNEESTDIQIVASAFDYWETDCFHRILGDWAVSIWSPQRRELILATDYMCVRHIFYFVKKDRVWWSSDLGSLALLSGDKFHVDDDYVAGYLAHDPDAHLTPYREIREAPPGKFARIRSDNVLIEPYWCFNPKSRINYRTDAEYEEHFRHVFRNSVRRRLRSDSPVLAELSGGLDSSSIVCVADDILAREQSETPGLDTISYLDPTEPNGDDWVYFRKIEEKRKRTGIHIDASKVGTASNSLKFTQFVSVPGYLGYARMVEAERAAMIQAGGYRAVLSGLGGDEFSGGIPDPRAQLADLIVRFQPVALVQQLIAWGLAKRKPWIQLLWEASTILLPASLAQYTIKEAKVEQWIDKEFASRTGLSLRLLGHRTDLGAYLPTCRCLLAGVLSMANKLAKRTSQGMEEKRYPFLDRDLIEFILSIPATQLLRPGQRRSLVCRSLAGTVPQEILERRTKQFGARTPVLALKSNWRELEIALAEPVIAQLGFVDRNRLWATLRDALNGKMVHISRLMKTVALEFWLQDLLSRNLLDVGPVSLK